MQYVPLIMAGVSAIGQMNAGEQQASFMRQQGEMQAASLRFQGQMALIQSEQKSISYQREELNARRQAEDVKERLARANSAVIARAAAMNIMPFSGSPLDLQKYNSQKAGSEWEIAQSNADAAQTGSKQALQFGKMQQAENEYAAQSAIWGANAQADMTESKSMMSALMTAGQGAYGSYKLGAFSSGGSGTFNGLNTSKIKPWG